MEKHTPTPWKVTKLSHANDQLWLQITGPDGRGPIVRVNSPGEPMPDGVIAESKLLITSEENQLANADFIVRACNSHAALLAACKLGLKFLDADRDNEENLQVMKENFQSAIKAGGGE